MANTVAQSALSLSAAVVHVAANYTIALHDFAIWANTSSGVVALGLPSAATAIGKVYCLKNLGPNDLILAAAGVDTIDGAATLTLGQYDSVTLLSDGTTWSII